jgi:hypothetical protein
LVHAFEEGRDLRHAELGGIAIQVGEVFIDDCIDLQVADRIDDLCRRRFAVRDAIVEESPSGLWQAGPNRGLVPGRQVAFDNHHVEQDLVRLREQLDDRRNLVIVFESFRPIRVG